MSRMATRKQDDQKGRAILLGALGSTVGLVLAAALTASCVQQWTGWRVEDVAGGLALLATGAAALTSGWITLVLAAATADLAGRPAGAGLGPAAGRGDATGGRAPVGRPVIERVVAGLLVLGSVGLTPSVARAAEPVHVVADVGWAPVSHPGSPLLAAAHLPRPGAPDAAAPHGQHDGTAPSLPQPGWTPTVSAPPARPSTDVGLVSTPPSEPVEHVVVHRGDTLWGLAARHLGDRATDQDVAEEWPRWYAANRDVIGDDPDLILPGQQLVVPSSGGRR